jgi:hypothetical protein
MAICILGHIPPWKKMSEGFQCVEVKFPCVCGRDGSEFQGFMEAGYFSNPRYAPVIRDVCAKGVTEARAKNTVKCTHIIREYDEPLKTNTSITAAACEIIVNSWAWDSASFQYPQARKRVPGQHKV